MRLQSNLALRLKNKGWSIGHPLFFVSKSVCGIEECVPPPNRQLRGEVCSRMCVSPPNRPFRGEVCSLMCCSPPNRAFRGQVCSLMCCSPPNRAFRGQVRSLMCCSPRNQRFRGEVSLFDAKIVRTEAFERCSVECFLVVRMRDADECLCTLLH